VIQHVNYKMPIVDLDERQRIAMQFRIDGGLMWGVPNSKGGLNTRGWQTRAANHLKRTPQTITNWVKGYTPIPVEVLELVAQALGRETKPTVLTYDEQRDLLPATSTHKNQGT